MTPYQGGKPIAKQVITFVVADGDKNILKTADANWDKVTQAKLYLVGAAAAVAADPNQTIAEQSFYGATSTGAAPMVNNQIEYLHTKAQINAYKIKAVASGTQTLVVFYFQDQG